MAAIVASGGDATAVVGDVTDAAFVAELAAGAGDVDIVVNNVGHYLVTG